MPTTELIGVAGMTNELKTFYSKQLLARLVPALEHANHGLAEDIPPEALRSSDKKMLIPPLHGALLKNEQDVHLFERVAFLARSGR